MNHALQPLTIHSAQGEYRVDFPESIDAAVSAAAALPNVVVVADKAVARLHRQPLRPLLDSRPCLLLEATEATKTPAGVVETWEFLLKSRASRETHVVVIGGGIIQDIAQFAAHNFHRGLAWHFIPTTLLSMADSCIGAKCGINLGAYKNQLGVFHSPAGVWICRDFLATLSDADVCSGYGEILKLHLTRSSGDLFRDLRRTLDQEGWRNRNLVSFIRRSLEVKKAVIEEDEYERDLRRILNYGHTFGHALEAITNHAVPHGIAVAWGIDLVNFISWRTGQIPLEHFQEVHEFIARHFAWAVSRSVGADELIDATRRDKKNRNGLLTLIVPKEIGTLAIIQRPYDQELHGLVTEYLAKYDVCARA
jgi:3-dehydroquinate synthase